MKVISQMAVIAGVALAAAGTTYLVKGPPERRLQCDPAVLKPNEICLGQVPDGVEVVWVDARSRKDWEANGLPGSVLWNLDPTEDMRVFEADAAARILMTPFVIVYCGDENCGVSHQVAGRIRALDMGAEIKVLRGGWRALSEAGRVRGSSPEP